MPLYILTAKILAIHIRANQVFQGLCPPDTRTDVKLSQFTNDTTLGLGFEGTLFSGNFIFLEW